MNRLNGGMPPRYRIALVRESEAPFTSFPVFHNSAELFEAFREEFAALDREVFAVITLDVKNRMIGLHTAAVGSLSSSIVVPRDVLKVAVAQSAASIICCHNHVSGDAAPSREDRECTERLAAAAKILGIRLLDHIVFGEEHFSFADAGLINPA